MFLIFKCRFEFFKKSAKLWDVRSARPPAAARSAARTLPGSYYDYRHGMLDHMMRGAQRNREPGKICSFYFIIPNKQTKTNIIEIVLFFGFFDYIERRYRHALETSLQTYSGGHRVYRTLLRAHFSPLESTGSRYVCAGTTLESLLFALKFHYAKHLLHTIFQKDL